MTGNYCL